MVYKLGPHQTSCLLKSGSEHLRTLNLESGCLCGQAKAGKKEDLSSCLQRLRGVDFSVATEIADIQVCV